MSSYFDLVYFWALFYLCFLFKLKALRTIWKEHQRHLDMHTEEDMASDILMSVELVLDNHDQLCEINRLPGENEASIVSFACL